MLKSSIVLGLSASALGLPQSPLHHLSVNGELDDGVWTYLEIGTPPQKVSVLFDTGSSTLAVPPAGLSGDNCQVCKTFGKTCQFPQCSEGDSLSAKNCAWGAYDPGQSKTHSWMSAGNSECGTGTASSNADRCPVVMRYGISTVEACHQGFLGAVVTDKVGIGGVSANISFVSIETLQSGFQEPPVSGIMGVAFQELNDLEGSMSDDTVQTDLPVAFGQLLKGAGLADEFSLCMGTVDKPGTLVLGGIDSQYYTGDWQTVSATSTGYFGVPVKGMNINGNYFGTKDMSSAWSSGSAYNGFADSGTPELMLPTAIYNAINPVNNPVYCDTIADCTLTIEVDDGAGGTIELQAPDLMDCSTNMPSPAHTFAKKVCIPAGWIDDGVDQTILGYAVLRNFYTHFNRKDVTLGFAAATAACAPHPLPALHKTIVAVAPKPDTGGGSDDDDKESETTKFSASDGLGVGLTFGALGAVGVVVAAFVLLSRKNTKALEDSHEMLVMDSDV